MRENAMSVVWSEKYSLNHIKIDDQHKALFHLASSVEELDTQKSTKEELAVLIKQLFKYMREHFNDEEEYMQNIGYPLLPEHKKEHEKFINSMTDILKETKGLELLQSKIKTLSYQWRTKHVLSSDLAIEKWRRSHMIDTE